MAGISGGGGGGGFDYVQDGYPAAKEGEELYHTGENAAYVYDGSNWIEQTVVDHGQLSGVGASNHHSRPTGTQSVGAHTLSITNGMGNIGTIGNGERKSTTDTDRKLTADRVEVNFTLDSSKDTELWFYVQDLSGTDFGTVANRRENTAGGYSLSIAFGQPKVLRGCRLEAKNYDGDFQDVTNVSATYDIVGPAGAHSHSI